MGDLEASKHPVHSLETDLEASRLFEHVGMLGQGGIGMGLQLFQKLCFVDDRYRPVTACGFDPNVQGVVVMPFQITFDCGDVDGEMTCRFVRRRSTENQVDDSTPKLQSVAVDPCCIHKSIMPNALEDGDDRLGPFLKTFAEHEADVEFAANLQASGALAVLRERGASLEEALELLA